MNSLPAQTVFIEQVSHNTVFQFQVALQKTGHCRELVKKTQCSNLEESDSEEDDMTIPCELALELGDETWTNRSNVSNRFRW